MLPLLHFLLTHPLSTNDITHSPTPEMNRVAQIVAGASALTLLLFSQTCPAPAIPAIGAAVRGISTGISAASAIDEATSKKRSLNIEKREPRFHNNHNNGDRRPDRHHGGGRRGGGGGGGEAVDWDDFNQCVAQLMVNDDIWSINRPGYLEISNCPQVCADVINDYNAAPNIEELNEAYGTLTWDQGGTMTYAAPGRENENFKRGMVAKEMHA